MIKVFNALDKDYTSNGDAVIIPLKARVKNSDNGDFYLEMTCGTEYNDYIQPNNILVAPTPQGEQAFRISSNITKTKKKITVKAWHIFYDSNNYLIADSYAVNLGDNIPILDASFVCCTARDNRVSFATTGILRIEICAVVYWKIISLGDFWGNSNI